MKIKHFAGYGTVTARKVNDGTCKLHIRVEGNHERGIVREDIYDLYNWLVKKFDKTVPDVTTWLRSRPLIDFKTDFRTDPILGVIDICDYYFTY